MEIFLCNIASEIEDIIRNDAKKAQFLKSIKAYREMREKFLQALQQCKNEAVKNQLFYDENAAEPPMGKEKWEEEGWELEKDYLIGTPSYRAFWRLPLPFNPDAWIMHYYGSPQYNGIVAIPAVPREPKEPDHSENLVCEYAMLSVIHDCSRKKPQSQKLTNNDDSGWVERLWRSISWYNSIADVNSYEDRTANIKNALENVKTDLPEKPAETGQKPTPAKRLGIRACLKGLPKELYGLTIERITKAYLDKYG